MLWVFVWIPGTEAFVSSGTAPLVEVLAGLVGLTCRTGSLCTSLSGLVSGFTCTYSFLAGFRNCLFLLNVVPPDWTMYDLSKSFSVQVPFSYVWFLWSCVTFTSCPISSSGNCMMFLSWENLAFCLFSWRLSTELWFIVGCSRLAVVGNKVWVFLDISLWAGLAPTPSVGVLR